MADLLAQLQTTLGDAYLIERELGGGAMSRVFLAVETRLDRRVVIKVLSPELAQGISVERFEREIRLAASLQQANIVPVLTAGETAGLPFYIMPFVEGESLRDRLSRGVLPVAEVVSVLRDLSRALAYAHAHGVVHRDIKTDNVLLSAGTAVVTDFGIAKALRAARTGFRSEALTQFGTSIGTPAYMAPEQAAGDPDVDARADLYALGCVAYELLSGRTPFGGRSAAQALVAQMRERPRLITDRRPDTPRVLADLVMRCLAKEPANRPESAGEIGRTLEAISSGQLLALPGIVSDDRAVFSRALLWYAAAFAAVAVVTRLAILEIGLPGWVLPGALVVMALGLPVLLFVAYAHRVTRLVAAATPVAIPDAGQSPSRSHGTLAALAIRASPHLSWRGARTGCAIALVAFALFTAGFMVLRALGVGPAGSLLASGAVDREAPILVTDFTIHNADTSLATVLSSAARAGLEQSSVIRVVSPAEIAATLTRMRQPVSQHLDAALARDMAPRLGSSAIVEGDLTGVGDGFIVGLRLVAAQSGRELASFQTTGSGPKGLIDAIGTLTRRLRDKIGESLREVARTPPLSQATTASLDALRAYTRANWANDVEANYTAALRYALQAVTIDSTFAEAWRKLAAVRINARAPTSEVNDALRHAFAYRERLPTTERLQIEATYFWVGPGRDRGRGIDVMREMMARGDSSTGNNLGIALASRRDFEAADSAFRIAIRADSAWVVPYIGLIEALFYQDRRDEVDSVLTLIHRRFPAFDPTGQIAQVLYSAGRLDSTAELARQLRASDASRNRREGLRFAAGIALAQGRLDAWRRFTDSGRVADAAANAAPPALVDSATEAWVDAWPRGQADDGVRRLDAGLAATPMAALTAVDRPYFAVAVAYAMNQRPDKAREIIAQYHAQVHDTALVRSNTPELHTVLGEIALAEHKPLVAIREFRLGDTASDGPVNACVACLAFEVARAFEDAGEPDSAIVYYRQFLSLPTWYQSPYPWLELPRTIPWAHLHLGELCQRQGERADALLQYHTFLDLYRHPDAELQSLVSDVRRRVAALQVG
jgi:eukaryotic-like serine/threonine-protein kinase